MMVYMLKLSRTVIWGDLLEGQIYMCRCGSSSGVRLHRVWYMTYSCTDWVCAKLGACSEYYFQTKEQLSSIDWYKMHLTSRDSQETGRPSLLKPEGRITASTMWWKERAALFRNYWRTFNMYWSVYLISLVLLFLVVFSFLSTLQTTAVLVIYFDLSEISPKLGDLA